MRHYNWATRFVRLKGMVTREELLDPAEAAEILEDTEVKRAVQVDCVCV